MNIIKENIRQTRDLSIDIIKGIGIFCMVAGHSGSPITKFIYLFHMAIFFMASGYCYKEENSNSSMLVLGFIKKKFLTLWFPYVLWNAIYSCLHNFFIDINVYTDNPLLLEYVSGTYIRTTEYWTIFDVLKNILKSLVLLGNTQIGGAFWFIGTLMELSIIYCIIDFIIKRILKKDDTFKIQFIISGVFLCLGYGCHMMNHSLLGIDKVLSYYVLFHGGYALKKYSFLMKKRRKNSEHLLVCGLMFIILLICNKIGGIELGQNSYENPLYFLVVSFAGWLFLYEMAYFIKKSKKLSSVIACAGQNTMAVVILHFLCFKIVSCLGVLIKGEPLFLIAAFPILYSGGIWWLFYSAVGLILPICLSILWKRLKNCHVNFL